MSPRALGQPAGQSRYQLWAIVIVAAVMAFLITTVRPGHNWDGDYALYIMQAENLANGTSYASTHFIPNPDNAIAPALYPPGLPLLLAPFYHAFGVDLEQMKWLGLMGLAGFLLIFAHIARDFVGERLALMVTALFGLHPYVWAFKDTIYSEYPFMLFSYGGLALAHWSISGAAANRKWIAAAGIAFTVAFAYLIRTIGVVLFPAIIAVSVLRERRLWTTVVAGAVGAMLAVALVLLWFPGDAGTYVGYFDQLSVASLLDAVRAYSRAVSVLLQSQVLRVPILDLASVLLLFSLACVGFFTRLRRSFSVYEFFLAAYVGLLLIFPVHEEPARYSMPVWPLLLIYAVAGAARIGEIIAGARGLQYLPMLMVICLACPYAYVYAKMTIEPIEHSVTAPPSQALFQALRTQMPPDGVVLARKPTIIALFTDRHAAIWPASFEDDEFWRYAHKIGANYLVQDRYHFSITGGFNPNDRFDAFVARNQSSLQLIFHNEWFNVYRFDTPQISQ